MVPSGVSTDIDPRPLVLCAGSEDGWPSMRTLSEVLVLSGEVHVVSDISTMSSDSSLSARARSVMLRTSISSAFPPYALAHP